MELARFMAAAAVAGEGKAEAFAEVKTKEKASGCEGGISRRKSVGQNGIWTATMTELQSLMAG